MLKYDKDKEKAAFKTLTPKQKREHIWEYYRLAIIGTIVGLICVGWALNHYIINPAKDASVAIVCHAYQVSEDDYDAFTDDLKAALPDLYTSDTEITITNNMVGLDDSEMEYTATMKMLAMISAQNVDIVIGDYDAMEQDALNSYFAPLDEIFTEEELATLQEKAYVQEDEEAEKTGVVNITPMDMDTDGQYYYLDEHPYFIDISGNMNARTVLTGEATYVGVIVDNQHMDDAKRVLWYLVTGEQYTGTTDDTVTE